MSLTATTASDDQQFGLIIQPTGVFRLLAWLPVSTPRHALRCDKAHPVGLSETLTLWVDEDAAAYGEHPNVAAQALVTLYRPHPLPFLGDVVLTGPAHDEDGARGLSLPQTLALVDLYLAAATVPLVVPRPRS
ncbi:DUF3846 domain-containing protein [Streptomyces sp. NPDC004230]